MARRRIEQAGIVTALLLTVAGILILAWPSKTNARLAGAAEPAAALPTAAPAAVPLQVAAEDVEIALYSIGLTPQALAAAGLNPIETTALLSEAVSYLMQEPGPISYAQAAGELSAQVEQLNRTIRGGQAEEEDITARNALQAQLDLSRAVQQAQANALFEAVTANLAADRVNVLANIRAQRDVRLPVHFRTVQLTDAEQLALRRALANERIAAKYDEEPDPGDQAIIADWLSNTTVSTAQVFVASNLIAIEAAWAQALQQ